MVDFLEDWQTGSFFTGKLVISIDIWDETQYRLLRNLTRTFENGSQNCVDSKENLKKTGIMHRKPQNLVRLGWYS